MQVVALARVKSLGLAACWLLALPAQATEVDIGSKRRFGLGIAAGFPSSASAKILFDRKNGLALHVGPTLVTSGLHLRLQFEQHAMELKRWGFGELWFTWNVGFVVNLVFGEQVARQSVRPGVSAGVGVDLRLVPVPVSVFGEVSPAIYPLDINPPEPTPYLPAGVTVVVGARFYF